MCIQEVLLTSTEKGATNDILELSHRWCIKCNGFLLGCFATSPPWDMMRDNGQSAGPCLSPEGDKKAEPWILGATLQRSSTVGSVDSRNYHKYALIIAEWISQFSS